LKASRTAFEALPAPSLATSEARDFPGLPGS
jgi:hypothetical protein